MALATDRFDPAGVYFGNTSGTVFGGADEGRGWQAIAQHRPATPAVEGLLAAN